MGGRFYSLSALLVIVKPERDDWAGGHYIMDTDLTSRN